MKREFIPMSGLYDMNIGALRMYYAQRPTPKPENEVKNVVFRCDVVKDKDILEALKDVKNKSDYIKSLLRRALQEENAEKERTEKEESCLALPKAPRRRRQRSNFRLAVFVWKNQSRVGIQRGFCFQERACEEKFSSEKSESSSNVSLISFAARAICCFVCVAV